MLIRNIDRDAEPFTTVDGSTIREIMHPRYGEGALQSLAEATLPAGAATVRHWHADAEELYFILSGRGRMEVDGDAREVGAGDCVLIAPGARHTIEALEDLRFLCCCAPPYRHEDTFFDAGDAGGLSG